VNNAILQSTRLRKKEATHGTELYEI